MDRLQRSLSISDRFGGEPSDATVFGCDPDHEQPTLRDRATLAVSTGHAGFHLKMTRAELLALAALLTQAADTIPQDRAAADRYAGRELSATV
jgi:hypothetical protein